MQMLYKVLEDLKNQDIYKIIFWWVKAQVKDFSVGQNGQSQQNAGQEVWTWSFKFKNQPMHHWANMLSLNIMAYILYIVKIKY